MNIMSNITKTSALLACGLGLTSGPLQAAPSSHLLHHRGAVQHIELSARTFTMLDRRDAILGVEWNDQTRFYEHGRSIPPRDLKPGEEVSVACERHPNGELLAHTVRIVAETGRASPS